MDLAQVKSQSHGIAYSGRRTRIYSCGKVGLLYIKVQEHLCAQKLVYADSCLDHALWRSIQPILIVMQILGTDTQGNCLSNVSLCVQNFPFSAGREMV